MPSYTQHVGRPWAHVCEAMIRAKLCIGLDSGPAHVAGTLDVPFLCIVGPTMKGGGFEYTPSVEFVASDVSDVPCVGCHWRGEYRRSACEVGCEALQRLRSSAVLDRARAMLCESTK